MNRQAVAEVVPLVSLPRQLTYFDYRLPADDHFTEGNLVRVNFRGRPVLGVITRLKSSSDLPFSKLSLVIGRLDGGELSPGQIDLALRISRYYHVAPGIVFKSFVVPPLLRTVPSSSVGRAFVFKARVKSGASNTPVFIQYEQPTDRNNHFFDLIKSARIKNKTSLVIFPEIREAEMFFSSLPPSFKASGSLVHGSLPGSEHRAIRQRLWRGSPSVVVGTTAALFEPVQRLGLVIIDDESNDSYKQTDRQPHYHGRQVAIELAEINQARLVFAGPLPSLDALDYLERKSGQWRRLTDFKRRRPVIDTGLVSNETMARGLPLVSETLADLIEAGINQSRRTLIYHNRLGLANRIMCADCGWQPSCPVCHIGYKLSGQSLCCHSCGRGEKTPLVCPRCRGASLKPRGLGVEKLKEAFFKRWPSAKVLILDDKHPLDRANLLAAQIIIATSKVWRVDLPPIHILALLSLEAELGRADWRGNEQAYRLLLKLAGLSAGHLETLIIQTSHPDSQIIKHFCARNDRAWLKSEQADRATFRYPPFIQLVKLTITGREVKSINSAAIELRQRLLSSKQPGRSIIDCSPPTVVSGLQRGLKRLNLMVKLARGLTPDERILCLSPLGSDWYIDVDPINLD